MNIIVVEVLEHDEDLVHFDLSLVLADGIEGSVLKDFFLHGFFTTLIDVKLEEAQ